MAANLPDEVRNLYDDVFFAQNAVVYVDEFPEKFTPEMWHDLVVKLEFMSDGR